MEGAMANRLLPYEFALFRRSFADAFGRRRDKVLLAFALLLAVLVGPAWLQDLASHRLPREAALAALAAFLPGHGCQRLVAERLRWLAENSAIAADALDPAYRRRYFAAAHLAALVPTLCALLILAIVTATPAAVALGLAAYAAGAAAGSRGRGRRAPPPAATAPRPGPRAALGRRAAFWAVLRRQTLDGRRPAVATPILVAAVFSATAAAAYFGGGFGSVAALALAAAPSLAAAAILARLDAELLGFLPYAGYGAGFAALAVAALPIACLAAASFAVLVAGVPDPGALLLVLLLLYVLVAITSIARAWLYPGRSRRAVEVQIQIELVAAGLLAASFPPLGVAAVAARLFLLRQRYRALLWKAL